ncbi:hypothetical protein CFD26_108056 [Aspergillus turcosus]|uniref:NACHT domain-containing protein n=1 Tax=Aspergillus turcosus TaxID=1245748 RepID=A0A421DD54_9EURO|nr:hypothetical protein CFD26_108056 [Aspergillus turcosus]
MSTTRSHDDYTVAWICSLSLEKTAAVLLLDTQHPPLPKAPSDENSYIFGEIQGHNIVIVCLPLGVYGTNSAAVSVAQMKTTFPSIRYALVVGIGGGAPSVDHDIRLGDVVVSKPTADHGGVIQYDYGKALVGGRFQRTGTLNKPPTVLLNAIAELHSRYQRGEGCIDAFLSAALASSSVSSEFFVRPHDQEDLLFRFDYCHADESKSCDACDKSQAVDRPSRRVTHPFIHYGTIASGNQVMKDGNKRQQFAEQEQILCFEMEAAGVMDQIPSLNDLLPYAPQAAFDGQNVHDVCLENTRVQILREITDWATAPSGSHRQPIFWLNGNAGTGKSTVAKTIAASLARKKKLGGSFFFNVADSQCSGLDLFFTTLANHLIHYQPIVGRRILDAIKHHHMIKTASFESQWERLILGPIAEAGREGSPIVLVIDALDECIGDRKRHANILLTMLAELARDDKVQLRVFVTSRPEALRFHQIAKERLHEVNLHYAADGEHDVSYFLRWQLNQIRELFCPEDKSWPDAKDVLAIQRQGGNLFVYAAAVCRLLRESELDYDRKLKDIARSTNSGVDALFDIYRRILLHAIPPDYSASPLDPFCSAVTFVLETVVVLREPLSSLEIDELLIWQPPPFPARRIIQLIPSIFETLNKDSMTPETAIRLYHPSFRDFLLHKSRVGEPFWNTAAAAHTYVLKNCYGVMHATLKVDIYGVSDPGILANEIDPDSADRNLPSHLRYACRYWVYHLLEADLDDCHEATVRLLEVHFLHWVESMVLMGEIAEAVFSITALRDLPTSHFQPYPRLAALISDASLFLLNCRSIIEKAPLQLYHSAILFSPENSLIRQNFLCSKESENSLFCCFSIFPRYENWDSSTQRRKYDLVGHTRDILAFSFSPCGKRLASSSYDYTVRVWNLTTGQCSQTVSTRGRLVKAILVLDGGDQLAVGSEDGDIGLWNPAERKYLTVQGHTNVVTALALSTSSTFLASGSADKTVRLWAFPTLECTFVFDHLSHAARSLAFSQCGSFFAFRAAGYEDYWNGGIFSAPVKLKRLNDHYCIDWANMTNITIQQVSADGKLTPVLNSGPKLCMHNFKWERGLIKGVAISPSGRRVATVPLGGVAAYWDLKTGQTHLLESGPNMAYYNCPSFCGEDRLVAREQSGKIIVWDIGAGGRHVIMELTGHVSGDIIGSSSSQMLISAREDGMLSVWDVAETRPKENPTVLHDQLERLFFLPDGRLASICLTTARIWDAPTLQMKKEFHYPHIYSDYEISPEGLLVSDDHGTINVFDLNTGASWQCPPIHSGEITFLKLGSNGLLASGSRDGLVCIWNIRNGQLIHQFNVHTGESGEVYFCDAFLNDDFLAASEIKGQIFVWELSTGECHLLRGHTGSANFTLSENGRFASCDGHGNVRIWSCTTWACEVALSGIVSGVDYAASERELVLTEEQIYAPRRCLVHIQDIETEERSRVRDIDLEDPIILAALKRETLWCCESDHDGNWIKYGGQRLLCLPDYDHICDYQVSGNTVVVGYGNGRIILIQFDPDKRPSAFASVRSSTSDLGQDDTPTLSEVCLLHCFSMPL